MVSPSPCAAEPKRRLRQHRHPRSLVRGKKQRSSLKTKQPGEHCLYVSILLGIFLSSFVTDIYGKLRNHRAKRKYDDQPEPYHVVIHIIHSLSKKVLYSNESNEQVSLR